MKKLFFTFILLLSVAARTIAWNAIIDGIYYNYSGNEATVTYLYPEGSSLNSSAYSGAVVIPESINSAGTRKVTSIGYWAFAWCSDLTSVTIGNNVKNIDSKAFYHCSGLTSVTIPESVTSIGDDAFSVCSSLTSITIPNRVKSIGVSAFGNCSSLTSLTIPNSVTSIGNSFYSNAFMGCSGLTSIEVASGNSKYDSRNNCNAIIETATNTLITGCQNTIIPNSVTCIDEYAFSGCKNLTYIAIPNSVTWIREGAFSGCKNLTDVYCYAEIVPNLNSTAFSNIASATLHVPAASLEAYCTTAPWSGFGSIVAIDDSPIITFTDANVKALCVANWNANHDGELSEAEAAAVTNLGEVFRGNTTITSFNELQYFTGLNTISDNAFFDCSSLTSVTIPNSVTSIGDRAFAVCSSLTSVTIPNSVTSIGRYAFSDCSGLTSVTIPNSVTSVGDCAFSDCSGLTSVTIPNGVTSIGDDAFYGCSSLTSVTIPNGVTSIGDDAFYGCSSLTSVTIPNSVTSIGSGAFFDCSSLTSVTIPNNVTSIGTYAFYGCTGLSSVTIPNSVTSIGEGAFATGGLTSINVEEGNSVFDSRDNCNAIIITATNTLVAGCQTTTIPNSVTSIGAEAFAYCSGLISVTIPNSVTSIGDEAFDGCGSLTDVYCFAMNVPSVNGKTFSSLNLSSMTLHVLASVVNSYKAAKYWRNFGTILGMREDIVATGIQLNMTSLKLNGIGSTEQLIATVSPSNATNQNVTWRSTDVTVVTVDDNGLVTAVGAGNAQVIATTTDGSNLTASCLIDVTLGNSKPGDVNGDGDVNSGDVMSIYSIMAGRSSLDRELGDVNGDGQVNSGDVMRVYSIMAGNY